MTTYISHIREVVRKADLKENLRQAILTKIEQLQRQVEQDRTPLEAVINVWLALTEAAGKGAKNLEPAVNLVNKIGGAFSGLRQVEIEQQPQIPSPETLGLPDFSNMTDEQP